MLKDRQKIILKHIVEIFVKTGKAISSKAVEEFPDLDCSTATIRNEMATLEQLGFLEQLYVSGGRKPTTKGMQYYVDNLMSNLEVSLTEELNNLFESRFENIDFVLNKASKLISEITNLATVVIAPQDSEEKLTKIQLNKVSKNVVVIVIITSEGNVHNRTFELSNKESVNDLEKLFNILDARLKNTPLNLLKEKLNAIEPIIANQIKNLEKIFQNFVYEMVSLNTAQEISHGSYRIVQYQDLDKEKMAKLIKLIENHSTFDQFIKEQDKDIAISEDGTSVIKHKYKVKNKTGHIAVIGPTRVEYQKVNALLDKVVEKIEKIYK